jgi:hypothetical protein
MIEPGRRDALRHATADTAARVQRTQEEVERRAPTPGPGDLCVFPATADLPLEWVILERDATDFTRVRVVPADTNPVAGPADVVIPREAACGPLHLRCAHALWIVWPEGARRTGTIAPELLQQAQERCVALANTPGAYEPASADAEYRDWIDNVVATGVRTLTVVRRTQPNTPPRVSPVLTAAASVLLALGLGFAVGRMPQATPDPALQATQDHAARLEAELQRLRAEPRREGADTGAPRPLINLPFVWLGPSETLRGPAPAVTLAPQDSMIVIVLQVDDPAPHRRYRLDVRAARTRQTVWSEHGLIKTGVSELAVILPRTLLPAGEYSLHLHDEPAGARAEYTLRIEHGPPARPRPAH